MSFLVDGELISRLQTTALAFSRPRGGSLDMRHRLPARLVGLAASLRSMPTAVREDYQVPIRRSEHFKSIHVKYGRQAQSDASGCFLLLDRTEACQAASSLHRITARQRRGALVAGQGAFLPSDGSVPGQAEGNRTGFTPGAGLIGTAPNALRKPSLLDKGTRTRKRGAACSPTRRVDQRQAQGVSNGRIACGGNRDDGC